MRYQGRISNWKDDKGFGFITPNGGGHAVFVHIRSFANRQRRPLGNEIVTYEIKADAQGRVQAANVAFVGERIPSVTPSGRSNVSLWLTALFLAFVVGSAFVGKVPFAILALYLVASVVALVAYAADKSAAKNERWRTPESTLHLVALVGGWPGALAAQRLLRHKTKKASFQLVFRGTVALNCGALGWLFSPHGAATLHSVIGAP